MKFDLTTKYEIASNIKKKFDLIVDLISKLEKISEDIFFEIVITNNAHIKKINDSYRKINKSTDVIAFSFWDNDQIKTNLLGEIFISYEKAKTQAKQFGHSFEREICFLLIHGIFHLLGYDHIQKAEEKIMFEKQKIILNKIFPKKEAENGKKS